MESFYQNDWGLWQMHGNVWEWCQDWFGAFSEKSVFNPVGHDTGNHRALRGGSYLDNGGDCRSACRDDEDPYYGNQELGFRLAIG